MNLLASSLFLALTPVTACAEPPQPSGASVPAPAQESTTLPFDQQHTLWTNVLKKHVRNDDFDYAALKRDPAEFNAYLKQLHVVTPDELATWTKEQRFAFWINVYNAHTIELIVENYPLKTIRDLDRALGLKSVFDDEFIPMQAFHQDGKDDLLSLNDVEHGILRERFKDARLHAAVNCASISCPPLRGEAFLASKLDTQLEEQMRGFVNDPARNRLDAAAGQLQLSEIFKWFAEDFERDAGSVREYLLLFVPEEKAELVRQAKLRYLDYDWGLNDTGKQS